MKKFHRCRVLFEILEGFLSVVGSIRLFVRYLKEQKKNEHGRNTSLEASIGMRDLNKRLAKNLKTRTMTENR